MPSKTRSLLILALVVIFTGIGAGLGGMLLALLLHGIQHLAYGYSLDSLISHETFLLGVTAAAPERRVLVLISCGLVAGVGWWLIYRYGRPLVSIKQAVSVARRCSTSARCSAGKVPSTYSLASSSMLFMPCTHAMPRGCV